MAPAGIYSIEHGPGDVPPPVVVMVHGTMDRSASFARAVRRLPELRVITYDRRGYGRSTQVPVERPSFDGHVDDLVAVVNGSGSRGASATVLIGHSFGGDVALAAALRRPDLVAAVGAYEPPMPWLEAWPAGGASMDIRRRGLSDPGDIAEQFIRNVAGDAAWEGLPERTRAQRRAEGPAVVGDITALTTGVPPFSIADLQQLGESEVSVHLASGTLSKPHQRDGTASLAAAIVAPLTAINGARHGGHSSHPDAFADWVRQVVVSARARGDD